MPPNMKTMIQKMGLRCISIGLKCIVPRIDDDSSDQKGLSIANLSVRNALLKEINQCFKKDEEHPN